MEFTREQATRSWVIEHWPHQAGLEFGYQSIDHPDGGWMRLTCRCGASHVTNEITEAYTRDRLIVLARGLGEPWGDAIAATLEAQSPVMAEIAEERRRQDSKWGGPAHDDTHTLLDWWSFMQMRMVGLAYPGGKADERRDLIQIAALAVAAVESLDRKARGEA